MVSIYNPELYGKVFGQVLELIYSGEDEKALVKIEALEELGPKHEVPYILKTWALGSLGRFREGLEVSEEAIALIKKSEFLNSDEKNYLEAFTLDMARIAAKKLGQKFEKFDKIDFSKIDLTKVDKKYLGEFTLPFHPSWDDSLIED